MEKRITQKDIIIILLLALVAWLLITSCSEPEPENIKVEIYSITQKVEFHTGSTELKYISSYWGKDTIYRITTKDHYLLKTQVLELDTNLHYTQRYNNIKTWNDTVTIETAHNIKCNRYLQAQQMIKTINYIDDIDCTGDYLFEWKNDTINFDGKTYYHYQGGYLCTDHDDIIYVDSAGAHLMLY